MEAALAAWVTLKNACTMVLMFTLGVDAKGGAGGAWGAGTVGARATKSGPEEATGEVWSHECRG